ncbi:MAG: 23S rRNA pseudouridine(955/2504/2580) synthase RluC [Pseudomonadota bacterium]
MDSPSHPPRSQARQYTVGPEDAGQRIDNFLMRTFKNVPKSHVYKMLRGGEVRVNKGRIKATYRLAAGDVVRLPPVRQEPAPAGGPGRAPVRRDLEDAILYEDPALLVINKPAGLAVHGGSGLSYGLIESLRAARPEAPFLELVHRLDRDTSGCLIVAKKRSALRSLHEQLRLGQMDKHYLVLVRGAWRGGARQVSTPLRKSVLRSGERMVQVDASGKEAATRFVPLRAFPQASLLRAELDTGRTHQIRVHLQSIGHPVAGDDKYGDPDFNQRMASLGLKRLFLHAAHLNFMHPVKGERLLIDAGLPAELEKVLEHLEGGSA